MAYAPTHDIPAGGLPAWTQPDGSQPPVTTLAAGLDVQLLEMRGQWGHVACSNGWEGWIDATRLVARAAATPEPTPAEAPEPEPAPVATPEPAPVVEPEPEPEATATPEPVAATSETGFAPTHTVPAGGIPMWADPDPSQAALATLAPGTEVRVVDERGQWADITLANGWEGWVDATRLVAVVAPDPVAAAASTPAPVTAFAPTHVAPAGGLQAWAAPDPSQPVATTLAAGTELRVAEQRGQWARVEASNGWWGWVDAARLEPR